MFRTAAFACALLAGSAHASQAATHSVSVGADGELLGKEAHDVVTHKTTDVFAREDIIKRADHQRRLDAHVNEKAVRDSSTNTGLKSSYLQVAVAGEKKGVNGHDGIDMTASELAQANDFHKGEAMAVPKNDAEKKELWFEKDLAAREAAVKAKEVALAKKEAAVEHPAGAATKKEEAKAPEQNKKDAPAALAEGAASASATNTATASLGTEKAAAVAVSTPDPTKNQINTNKNLNVHKRHICYKLHAANHRCNSPALRGAGAGGAAGGTEGGVGGSLVGGNSTSTAGGVVTDDDLGYGTEDDEADAYWSFSKNKQMRNIQDCAEASQKAGAAYFTHNPLTGDCWREKNTCFMTSTWDTTDIAQGYNYYYQVDCNQKGEALRL